MGFRSFLKRFVEALSRRKDRLTSSRVNPWDDQDTIARIEQGLLIAAAQRDSIQILDHLHELSLWSSPPHAIKALKAQAVQLIEELENKNLSTNANPRSILALRESILAEHQEREEKSRAAAKERESIDDLQRAAWQKQRDDVDQFHRRQAQQAAEAERRRHEQDRLAKEQAEAEAKAEAERLEQERIAAAERAEAERLRQEQERLAKQQAEAEAKAEAERLEQERIAAAERAEAERLRQEQDASPKSKLERLRPRPKPNALSKNALLRLNVRKPNAFAMSRIAKEQAEAEAKQSRTP